MLTVIQLPRTSRARMIANPLSKLLVTSFALIALITTTFLSGTQPAQAQTFQSPQAMLLAYYSAIGLRNYPKAYSYWLASNPAGTPTTPAQSYADFASGFLTTDRVEPYLGNWQVAPASAPVGETGRIPAVLVGYHTDGTIVSYNGCFDIGSDPAAAWGIVSANFTLIANVTPDAATITQALGVDCYAASNGLSPLTTASQINTLDDGQMLLSSYYKLVNQRSYADAYALWLHPTAGPKPNGAPARDYRPPYADFVAGYGDTTYVFGFYGQYSASGASAGHGYLAGTIPAVLIGYHTDGSVTAASGCYVLGNLSTGVKNLGIVSGYFKPFASTTTSSTVPDGRAISSALSLDCTTLPLQY